MYEILMALLVDTVNGLFIELELDSVWQLDLLHEVASGVGKMERQKQILNFWFQKYLFKEWIVFSTAGAFLSYTFGIVSDYINRIMRETVRMPQFEKVQSGYSWQEKIVD